MDQFKIEDLYLSLEELQSIRQDFFQELKRAFLGFPSEHFKISSSYLSRPAGNEFGEYWAVDFGGTKIRCKKIALENRQWKVLIDKQISFLQENGKHEKKPLAAIAKMIAMNSMIREKSFLGHAFSFVTDQENSEEMTLREWSKEINIPELIGKPINRSLQIELALYGRPEIEPSAILNDSVSTLLAGSYVKENTLIGGICGTGFNLCLYYTYPGQKPMIYNLESGYYGKLQMTTLDKKIDLKSTNHGKKIAEKQIGGRYLGELARIYLAEKNSFFRDLSSYSIHARDLSQWLESEPLNQWLEEKQVFVDEEVRAEMSEVGKAILIRSASLTAAMLAGVLDFSEEKGEKEVRSIFDGSLFTRIPSYRNTMTEVLEKLDKKIELFSLDDASCIGAAVAASMNRTRSKIF